MRRLLTAGISLDGASDHGVSEALYLRDPDENGVELYWDRPRDRWPVTADGKMAMFTRAWIFVICSRKSMIQEPIRRSRISEGPKDL